MPQGDAGGIAKSDQTLGRLGGALHRLFHQHMLAGCGRRGDDLLAGIGWGENQDGLDRRIGQEGFVTGGGGQAVFGAETRQFLSIAAPDAADIHLVAQGAERKGMRLGPHARPDHAQSEFAPFMRHSAASSYALVAP